MYVPHGALRTTGNDDDDDDQTLEGLLCHNIIFITCNIFYKSYFKLGYVIKQIYYVYSHV